MATRTAPKVVVVFTADKITKNFVRYTANDGAIVGNLYVAKSGEQPKEITIKLDSGE